MGQIIDKMENIYGKLSDMRQRYEERYKKAQKRYMELKNALADADLDTHRAEYEELERVYNQLYEDEIILADLKSVLDM